MSEKTTHQVNIHDSIEEVDAAMEPPKKKTSCTDLSLEEWNPEDNYLEELEHILRSPPTLQSLTCTYHYSQCDDEVYLPMKLENAHDNNMGEKMNAASGSDDMSMSYLYRSAQPPSNAVHMEVQENAKIPHNYHLAVDRSGTGLKIHPIAAPQVISKHNDVVEDGLDSLFLTEAFFSSAQRSNTAAAYSQAGVLFHNQEHEKLDPLRYRKIPLPIPTPLKLSPTSTPTVVSSLLNASNSSGIGSTFKTMNDIQDSKPHAAAPALIEASKIRSQFGFGSNHLVPSVPLPPPKTALSLLATKVSVSAPPHLSLTSTSTTTSALLSAESSSASFYERKKQKAKDSRVKLNESIDKLSVAINVSGSQSKLRASQLESLNFQGGSESTSLLESRKIHGIRIMDDAAKGAEAARKWDRPSFVGLAASMIQDLNSQCEFLFTEFQRMHSFLESTKQKSSNTTSTTDGENQFEVDVCKLCGTRSTLPSSTVISIDSSCVDELADKDGLYSRNSPKRLKMSHSPNPDSLKATTIFNLFSHGNAVCSIVSYLDPISFVRCASVCHKWRQVLQNVAGDYWFTKCIQRYGTFNVRRWEEIDETEMGQSSQRFNHDPYYMNLYKRMHQVNVRPKCMYDGNLRLGEGKLNNIASAWVSAVVRSNGETLRSVKRIRGANSYMSLHIVELRILLQNTGFSDSSLYIPEQLVSVDASTKRRGEEMFEITTDERFLKRITQLDGSPFIKNSNRSHDLRTSMPSAGELCTLELYESVVITVYIHAKQCPTTERFRQKARFMKLLINVNGATVPLIIPFTSPSYMNSVVSIYH